MALRKALHAGSWYSNVSGELSKQLETWLQQAPPSHGPARAIIVPHAGYQYSGASAAFAFRQIDPEEVHRIFILGPSHRVRLSGCALPLARKCATPLYELTVDGPVVDRLEMTGHFQFMPLDVDENEHSIEMQLPFIAKVMEARRGNFTIIPVLVGPLSAEQEAGYGQIFSPYLDDPGNLFVISSDFCHWGQRFRYTYYEPGHGAIHQSIEELDRLGMSIIENLSPADFASYLKKFGNTICGRHPIGILLNTVQEVMTHTNKKANLKFLEYAQSSRCRNMSDSSVSYAAASLLFD